MRIPGTTFYQAHSSNYTKGRNRPVRKLTVHHTAGWEQTLRRLWQDPSRNGSSTAYVSETVREQYVGLRDTPWTNGNFASNSESITVETRGDWRNGHRSQAALNQLEEIMYQALKIYPHLTLEYHMDVSLRPTLCPADLKHKGYALDCWRKAKKRIEQENKPVSKITYKKITPKRIELKEPAYLWNFSFKSWAEYNKNPAKWRVKAYPKGHDIDVVAEATNEAGERYYLTAYSYNEGKIRATNGFNVNDTKKHVPPKPTPEVPVPEKPIDTDPTTPGDGDFEQRLSALEKIVNLITTFLDGLFIKWRN